MDTKWDMANNGRVQGGSKSKPLQNRQYFFYHTKVSMRNYNGITRY